MLPIFFALALVRLPVADGYTPLTDSTITIAVGLWCDESTRSQAER